MCQRIQDGGRRCPIHRHGSKAFILAASLQSNELNTDQIERLMVELRREGRTSTLSYENFSEMREKLAEQTADLPENTQQKIVKQVELSKQNDEDVEPATIYAISTLMSRAAQRNEALTQFYADIANKTGLTVEEVKEKFWEAYNAVDTRRGTEPPAEYRIHTRNSAHQADLPQDRASVTAIEKLKQLADPNRLETRQRVELKPLPKESNLISRMGYHEGRLEIEFRDPDRRNHAFKNVTPKQWETITNHSSPDYVWPMILQPYNEYRSLAEEERDSISYRCQGCGQFRSASNHTCSKRGKNLNSITPEAALNQIEEALNGSENQTTEPQLAGNASKRKLLIPTVLAFPDMEPLALPTPEVGRDSGMTAEELEEANTPRMSDPLVRATIGSSNNLKGLKIEPEFGYKLVMLSTFNDYASMRFTNQETSNKVREAVIQRSRVIVEGLMQNGIFMGMKIVKVFPRDSTVVIDKKESKEETRSSVYIYDSLTFLQLKRTPPIATTYMEEIEEREAELNSFIAEATNDGKLVTINPTSPSQMENIALTRERGYVDRDNSYKASLPPKYQLRTAYKKGKAVASEISIYLDHLSESRDGVTYLDYSSETEISGLVVTRMNTDGVVELLKAELQCECGDYLSKYDCAHVRIAQNDIPLIYQGHVDIPIDIDGIDEQAEASISEADIEYSIKINDAGNGYIKISENSILQANFSRSFNPAMGDEESIAARFAELDGKAELTEEDKEFVEEMYVKARYFEEGQITRIKNRAAIVEVLKTTDVEIPVVYTYVGRRRSFVNGSVMLAAGSTPENPIVNGYDLKCSCYERSCQHVRASILSISESLSEDDSTHEWTPLPSPDSTVIFDKYSAAIKSVTETHTIMRNYNTDREGVETVRAIQLEAELTEKERQYRMVHSHPGASEYVDYRTSRAAAWENVGTSFSEDIESFKAENARVREKRRRGENVIEAKTENVTDGICAPGKNTRSFGIEIEFEIKSGVNKEEALMKIGNDLYAHSLTSDEEQQEYHTANGDWSRWSFEEDSTVDGEIVSPIMKDTPEHWAELSKVIEIVKRHGGVATAKTGSHVNISSGSFLASSAKHATLQRVMKENTATLFRMASNPHRGSHRGSEWCEPNLSVSEAEIPKIYIGEMAGANGAHGDMVNFEASLEVGYEGHSSNRLEYRLWDGTLDVGIIQQQVAISAALTDLAERETETNEGKYTPRVLEYPTDDDERAALLLDRLFRKEDDRRQAANLFAITNPVDM